MLIYYASLTGNVQRFVEKLNIETKCIREENASEPYVLITYTFGFGEVPIEVKKWLKNNGHLMRAVAVSGNRNWGDNYGKAGDLIAQEYGVPLLQKFELAGTDEDVRIFNERMLRFCDITN
ncbi:class Ib ribonucleoside-diphosphate reductase assembly flavoprotein NrdI [Lysinibacillus xylanilyticus]|uniref:Protein NrdI n=1 Tax=Lysinibacillus xylanilyticus TaxID=582475 RepID=A0ABT4EMB4_9BACI|nr:class Ib ribonucleoside-diphosphate reductase assembly flavoprotein NrdI [Lysinibacillus xylanilyticus]MCY9546810.1 class Ib ribonucleoside-diphosphate reductase assembly flavoprotein NrdI [Lysinibacillus xylanilyticus]